MPLVRYHGLRKAGRTRRTKRRASVATKAKYQAPTARNQRSQILGNARMIRAIKDQLPKPIMCDWLTRNSIQCEPSTDVNPVTFVTNGRELFNFPDWIPVMRQSEIVATKSSTRVYRMSMSIRYTLQASYWAQCSLFIVTLRKDFANRNPTGTNPLLVNEDYIANQLGVGPNPQGSQNIELNPSVFKVHYRRHVSMAKGPYANQPNEVANAAWTSNSQTTWKKGLVNIKMRVNVRNPRAGEPWKDMTQVDNLPYYHKYYLITAVTQEAEPGTPSPLSVIIDTMQHFCTVNSG